MIKLLEAGWLRKSILAGGLFLVFAIGAANLPDLALLLYPVSFLGDRLPYAALNTIKVQERIECMEAALSALDHVQKHGFPRRYEGLLPSETGVIQAIKRTQAALYACQGQNTELKCLLQGMEKLRTQGPQEDGPKDDK